MGLLAQTYKKSVSILLIFSALLLIILSLYGEIQKASSFSTLETESISPEDLVLIDFDNCLLEGKTPYGHAFWFYECVDRLKAMGKTREEAITTFYPKWLESQKVVETEIIDPNAPYFIARLQERGVKVMGLTHRQPPIAWITIVQLKEHGIDFRKSAPTVERSFTLDYPHDPLYHSGILFAHDFNPKGEVLATFLKKIDFHPRRIIFFDDIMSNLESVEKIAQALRIDFLGLHIPYSPKKEWIYDGEIATLQERLGKAE